MFRRSLAKNEDNLMNLNQDGLKDNLALKRNYSSPGGKLGNQICIPSLYRLSYREFVIVCFNRLYLCDQYLTLLVLSFFPLILHRKLKVEIHTPLQSTSTWNVQMFSLRCHTALTGQDKEDFYIWSIIWSSMRPLQTIMPLGYLFIKIHHIKKWCKWSIPVLIRSIFYVLYKFLCRGTR
jgi:hypothetical protein